MTNKISISRQYAPLRVCADICFYFFAVSLFSFSVLYTFSDETGVHAAVSNLIAPWSLQLAVLVSACFVVGLVIVRAESAALRFLLALLPGLSFFMSPFRAVMLIHLAAWIYYVVVMTIGAFEVHLDVYRRRAGVMLFIALLLACCLVIFHFGTDDWYNTRLFGGELYGLAFFVLSVLSLRGMRSSLGAPMSMRALDAAYVVVLPALLVAAFFLLRAAVPAITFLFSLLSRFLIWLFAILAPGRDTPDVFHPSDEEDVNKVINKEPSDLLPPGGDNRPDAEMALGSDPHFHVPPRVLLCLMLVVLAAAIVFIAVRLLRSREESDKRPRRARESVARMPFESLLRRRSGEPALPANVRQIRKIYRSYLELLRSLRMRISPSDCSQDVLEYSSKYLDLPENKELRALYIAARYGDPKAVTGAQVGEAKRCLSVIEAAKTRLADRE